MSSSFKSGDRVKCVEGWSDGTASVRRDEIYTVEKMTEDGRVMLVGNPSPAHYGYGGSWRSTRFQLVEAAQPQPYYRVREVVEVSTDGGKTWMEAQQYSARLAGLESALYGDSK